MKKYKKYQEYYEQRKLINEIFKNPKLIEQILDRGITDQDFKDKNLRIIFCWLLDKYKEDKNVRTVSLLMKSQLELKSKVGNLNKYFPL